MNWSDALKRKSFCMNVFKPIAVTIGILFLYLGNFFLSYSYSIENLGLGFWGSSLGTIYICSFLSLFYRGFSLKNFGISFNKKELTIALVTLIILFGVSYVFIKFRCESLGLILDRKNLFTVAGKTVSGFQAIHIFFQALNEEVLYGFLPLFTLKKYFKNDLLLASLVGLLFSFLHFWLYALSPFRYETYFLAPFTLFNLFLVGLVRNFLILRFKHVAYSTALHFSWNFHFFGWLYFENDQQISESRRFDLLLGWPVLTLLLLSFLALFLYKFREEEGRA